MEGGEVKVERNTDDGLGTKKTENYKAMRKEDGEQYEVSEDVIEKVAENQKIFVNKGT